MPEDVVSQLQLLLQSIGSMSESVGELREEVGSLQQILSMLKTQLVEQNGTLSLLRHRLDTVEERLKRLPCEDHSHRLVELGQFTKSHQTNWDRVAGAIIQVLIGVALGLLLRGTG